MRSLYVAAGGGGDGIAALAVARAMGGAPAPVVASYSWDRFVLDPAPGPRRVEDFDGLVEHAPGCWEVNPRTELRSGAQSTVIIGAVHTDARWFLLDPSRGATGVAEQLAAVCAATDADALTAVDVGGDILTHGNEPTLRSPLADSLTLAAVAMLDPSATVVLAGPGLDGELPPQLVHSRCRTLGATRLDLALTHMEPDLPVLQIHPSEATTLLAAALMGIRGKAEIRDNGTHVDLIDGSATAYVTSAAAALQENPLAQALRTSASLDEAEATTTKVCGRSELAYERRKAAQASHGRVGKVDADELMARLDVYIPQAIKRGSDLATFRRLTDALSLSRYDPARLRHALGAAADSRLPIVRLRHALDGHFGPATSSNRPMEPDPVECPDGHGVHNPGHKSL
jgi:hypothetical protein